MAVGWKKFTGKSQYPELTSNGEGSAFTYGSKRDRGFRMGWIQGRRDEQIEKELIEWINYVTVEKLTSTNAVEALSDGKILCKLLLRINPNILLRPINQKPPLFSATDNIANFIDSLRNCGFHDDELFPTAVLLEKRDLTPDYTKMNNQEVNSIIIDVLNIGTHEKPISKAITEDRIIKLLDCGKEILKVQGSMVEVETPIRICGDIHGQYPDLIRLFHRGGWPPTANYLFLGDYVDRGRFNLETIILLTAYKVRFPKNFFLLRGNHECEFVNKAYGFYEECQKRYSSTRLYEAFQDFFNWLPLSGLVAERILCMHGGLSPEIKTLNDLRNIQRPTAAKGPLELDLLWADPVIGLTGFMPNQRGAGVGFGKDVVHKLCTEMNIDLICRAHQVVQDGYEFFGGRKLVTLFSAPHYCGQFDNCAAFMIVDEKLQCSFEILRPTTGRLEVREKTLLKDDT
ncbi:unnamed protein product [Caenorhabditis bovis]|uniref:Serine/threonine-protein phosphatase n=1 Tax=Caenorhabditis bovis TaxID=2654633 RepID=A0A8S1E750_9PELO|nr:unnamed protein product [Caenorhabditis bovis]